MANAKELKKVYYKMVFKYHPDNRKDDNDDEKIMQPTDDGNQQCI